MSSSTHRRGREGSYHLLRAKTPFRKKRSCFRAGLKNAGIDKQNCLGRKDDCPDLVSTVSKPASAQRELLELRLQLLLPTFFPEAKNLLSERNVFLVNLISSAET
jgi:hypothetical protein